jgi:hypothetical protein
MTRRAKAIMRLRKAITHIIIGEREKRFWLQTINVIQRRRWVSFKMAELFLTTRTLTALNAFYGFHINFDKLITF